MTENTISSNLYLLAVEDDPLYAEALEVLLADMGYNNVSITDNGVDALKLFKQQPPDLLLMDINIKGPLNGIEMVEIASAIKKVPVIYVTSYDDAETFGKAKQTGPSAYLLKPYDDKNLEMAIELALFNTGNKSKNAGDENTGFKVDTANDAFFVKYNNRLLKIAVSDLLYIEVEEKYCYVHTKDRRYVINIRLKDLLAQLPPGAFLQTHRSFAVKLNAVEEVNLDDSVLKIQGKEIPIGRTYKDVLFTRLKTI